MLSGRSVGELQHSVYLAYVSQDEQFRVTLREIGPRAAAVTAPLAPARVESSGSTTGAEARR